jgi:hypothetical protein
MKAERREQKRNKKRYGMHVSGQSLKNLQNVLEMKRKEPK